MFTAPLRGNGLCTAYDGKRFNGFFLARLFQSCEVGAVSSRRRISLAFLKGPKRRILSFFPSEVKNRPSPSGIKERAFKGCKQRRQPLKGKTAGYARTPASLGSGFASVRWQPWKHTSAVSPDPLRGVRRPPKASEKGREEGPDPSAPAPGTNIKESIARSKQGCKWADRRDGQQTNTRA